MVNQGVVFSDYFGQPWSCHFLNVHQSSLRGYQFRWEAKQKADAINQQYHVCFGIVIN